MSAAFRSDIAVPYTTHPEETHRIACYEWGERTNPNVVFCVHGLTRNAQDFAFVAQVLAADYRVIAVDMPGRGESEWLKYKEEYNYASYLTYIKSILDQLALPPVHWLGTSMGGIIGMMLAASEPARFRSLVLNDIGAFISGESLRRIATYVGKRMQFSSRAEAEAAMREIYTPFGITEEAHWRHLLHYDLKTQAGSSVVRNYDPAIGDAMQDVAKITDVDLSGFWNAITCPVLVVHGETSDILTAATIQKMRELKPATQLLTVKGVGHAPPLFVADQIDPVCDFIRAH